MVQKAQLVKEMGLEIGEHDLPFRAIRDKKRELILDAIVVARQNISLSMRKVWLESWEAGEARAGMVGRGHVIQNLRSVEA
jgi:hypothetical protein